MYSFRVQSPLVIELLDALADKSAFIRDAVTEKFLARVAVSATATVEDRAVEIPVEGAEDDAQRLKDGLDAIRQTTADLLVDRGDALPEHVRTALSSLSRAATALISEAGVTEDPKALPEPAAGVGVRLPSDGSTPVPDPSGIASPTEADSDQTGAACASPQDPSSAIDPDRTPQRPLLTKRLRHEPAPTPFLLLR